VLRTNHEASLMQPFLAPLTSSLLDPGAFLQHSVGQHILCTKTPIQEHQKHVNCK